MKRLTEKNDVGSYYFPKCFEKCNGLGASSKCDNCENMTNACEKLGAYEDAEEQGLLLRLPAPLNGVESFNLDGKTTWYRLPCRIGDTVYMIDGATLKGHDWKYLTYEKAYVRETIFAIEHINSFGKTVFLTRAEAEAKLAEMEGAE